MGSSKIIWGQFHKIYLRQITMTKITLKTTYQKFHFNLPGANLPGANEFNCHLADKFSQNKYLYIYTIIQDVRVQDVGWFIYSHFFVLSSWNLFFQSKINVRQSLLKPVFWHGNRLYGLCLSFPTDYCQTSNISHTWVGDEIVDHSDVVGASPVGAAPTTSSFST